MGDNHDARELFLGEVGQRALAFARPVADELEPRDIRSLCHVDPPDRIDSRVHNQAKVRVVPVLNRDDGSRSNKLGALVDGY